MSKKTVFKGTINGKEFTNEAEFNKYLAEVLADNAETLSVSKSTETVDEKEKEEYVAPEAKIEQAPKKENILDTKTLELDEDAKLYPTSRGFAFPVNPKIVDAIRDADNKEDIKKALAELIDAVDKDTEKSTEKIAAYNSRIEDLRKEIDSIKDQILNERTNVIYNAAKKDHYTKMSEYAANPYKVAGFRYYPDLFDTLFEFWGLY